MIQKLEAMILDTLLEDIEGFEDIVRMLNSQHFSYLRRAKVNGFSKAEIQEALQRLLLAGYVRALEHTVDHLERRDTHEVDLEDLDDYYYELTDKGRDPALRAEW